MELFGLLLCLHCSINVLAFVILCTGLMFLGHVLSDNQPLLETQQRIGQGSTGRIAGVPGSGGNSSTSFL